MALHRHRRQEIAALNTLRMKVPIGPGEHTLVPRLSILSPADIDVRSASTVDLPASAEVLTCLAGANRPKNCAFRSDMRERLSSIPVAAAFPQVFRVACGFVG